MSGALAQSSFINELKQKYKTVNYTGKNPIEIHKRLPIIQHHAENERREGHDKQAFIYFNRWLEAVKWLKTTKEYKTGKLQDISTSQINEIEKSVLELQKKLEQNAKTNLPNNKTETVEKMEVDISLVLPEIPKDDPLGNETEEFVSCKHLYNLILNGERRMLIIDIREQADYQTSRIMCKKIINFPSSKIQLGQSYYTLYTYFKEDSSSFQLFLERGEKYVDELIFIDWNTTHETLKNNSKLSVLKNILLHWDPGVVYGKILYLDGGYAEWLTKYPTVTTNPTVNMPALSDDTAMDEILSEIEYPQYLHDDEEKTLKTSFDTKKSSNSLKSSIVYDKSPFKSAENSTENIGYISSQNMLNNFISSPLKTKVISEPKEHTFKRLEANETLHFYKKLSDKSVIDSTSKPVIDRSTKPQFDAKTILKVMKKHNEAIKENYNCHDELLNIQRSLACKRNEEPNSDEEKEIKQNLIEQCKKLEDMQKVYTASEEELDKYKTYQPVEFTEIEEQEKDRLLWDIKKNKRRLQEKTVEVKKFNERSQEVEQKKLRKQTEISEIHKEHLKADGPTSGGMERSHSSPNLLELRDRKLPQVDRSSKPQTVNDDLRQINNNVIRNTQLSWGNREERMNPVHGNVYPGLTGLKNLGNSCYMNSIIQCLSNTVRLSKYFNDNMYIDDLNRNKENANQVQVVEEVALVIKALWRGQYKSISPQDLKIAIGQYKLQFGSYEQQDSHEFLTFLLEWMHNDLKKPCKPQVYMSTAKKEWDKLMGSQTSIISDLFFGQLRSTITCAFCDEASTTYETFNSLTMSLSHSNKCTLNDCIQKFVSGQKVYGWKCPKCKVPREATKKFDFVKLPPVVVIYLNRFAESGGWLEKRSTMVEFPLTGFNLKPYLAMDNDTNISQGSCNYNLFAMSNHFGTMEAGHYTAYCKNAVQNKWYRYDDQTVAEVSSSFVKQQTASAYLLFYTSFPNEPYSYI
ncbi:ubiquitin carboxyl-terminal hydrolase 8-like [Prorops nasuta]|uniref:ubiquitin carboxyl-terminal hydrolase 8-like n=1 Tax=Prorops nasuta TaxID=863751 RepID=UPI0034CED7C9